jgi:hypothetical protein
MSHVTVELMEVAGGSLRVQLTTDHALGHLEREAFERIVGACQDYATCHPCLDCDDIDEAMAELGGEENICAG